jgi:hypothetical protein
MAHTVLIRTLLAAANPENLLMRYYLYAAVAGLILFFAAYKYTREAAIDKYGTTVMQAMVIERVRADVTEIAAAEKEYIVVNSECLDLDDLIQSKTLEKSLKERHGFTYSIRCTDLDFVVTATPPREPYRSKIHNPTITVNQRLEVREER